MTTRQEAQARYPALTQNIGGICEPGEGREVPVLDPTTGETLGQYQEISEAALDRALSLAQASFFIWKAKPAVERSRVLHQVAIAMREQAQQLAELVVLELGKPWVEALAEVEQAAGMWEWAAEEGRRAYGRIIPSREAGSRQMVLSEPLGPIAAFGSWNAPLITPSRKMAGALGAGCTVIMKASEEVPACVLSIARIAYECGVPEGALSVVIGDPAIISNRLIESDVIKGITFTGSTRIGQMLSAKAVKLGKRPIMELGGHAPALIFDDVDLEKTARAAARTKYRNCGQVCTSPTRFLVQRRIYGDFIAAFVAEAKTLRAGCGFDATTTLGPLIDARRVDAMDAFVQDARERGFDILTGGSTIERDGFFYEPTVINHATTEALVSNIEPFGPIAAFTPFGTYDEAIALANRLPFALASYVHTSNVHISIKAADDIEAGNVICNGWRVSLPETPFGGIKQSGFFSEGGIEGLAAFQNRKFVYVA